MLAVIDVHLPADIATVGEAVDYLLRRSGFNLLPADPGDYAVAYLLSQPLPDIHRHLGPVSLRDALHIVFAPVAAADVTILSFDVEYNDAIEPVLQPF
ncbi:MAG: hypothetical protein NTX45_00650 [Proteobacteria bacterium]|nr:hypothetical protein [Pseudomonadota bacterium]